MAEDVKSTGRLAGLVYLLMAFPGALSILYVPGRLFVDGDAQVTFDNISSSLSLLRLGIASGLVQQILFLALPFLLFPILARHGQFAARVMVAFVIVGVALYFSAMAHLYAIIPLVGGESTLAGEPAIQAMKYVESYQVNLRFASIFWGLWLVPFGYLVLVGAAIPRVIGLFLILGGIGYLLEFFVPLLLPGFPAQVAITALAGVASVVGEMGAALWLLINGVRTSSDRSASTSSPTTD